MYAFKFVESIDIYSARHFWRCIRCLVEKTLLNWKKNKNIPVELERTYFSSKLFCGKTKDCLSEWYAFETLPQYSTAGIGHKICQSSKLLGKALPVSNCWKIFIRKVKILSMFCSLLINACVISGCTCFVFVVLTRPCKCIQFYQFFCFSQ